MKRNIRYKVWETNSSSVHALYVDHTGLQKNHLKHKNGYVIADFGQFGKEYNLYMDQNDKLSYLLTEICYTKLYSEGIEDTYEFERLEEAIKDYDPTVKGIKVLKEVKPEIDHQSIPSYGESKFVNYWDKGSIQNFLFNKYIGFTTDCD